MSEILLKRIYDGPSHADGYRVLTDRLWPRGMTKERIRYDEWCKELAPSTGLRKWFHCDKMQNRSEFEQRYAAELHRNPDLNVYKNRLSKHAVVTLLTAATDVERSYLHVLKSVLEET